MHLRCFMLDALRTDTGGSGLQPELSDQTTPLAVIDTGSDGRTVCACDAVAAEAGVVPGMTINSALALLPALHTVPRDERRERALLTGIARLGLSFTPRVSLEPPDGVLLELRGSLRLFGGARAIQRQWQAQLHELGVSADVALAPTPRAALWLARAGQQVALPQVGMLPGYLGPLPLAVTRWPLRNLQLLGTMGVYTLADFMRLPRDGLSRRFDPALLLTLDRALGRLPEPRRTFQPAERCSLRRDLEPELEDTARIEHAVRPLIEELCRFLRGRDSAVQSLELKCMHRHGPPTRLQMGFMAPVADAARISELLHERLSGLRLPSPVRSLRLTGGLQLAATVTTDELFLDEQGQSASGKAAVQLIERLRARLGNDAVHGLGLVAEHRPEAAWCRIEAGARNAPYAVRTGVPRPLWLVDPPQPLTGTDRPFYQGVLQLEEGPERIESGWWDGHDIARDYYVAHNGKGLRVWLFRECRVRYATDTAWFLHGIFG